MSRSKPIVAGIVMAAVLPLASALAQAAPKSDSKIAIKSSALTYNDISVPGFDAGLKMAVLHGDPGKAEPYTLRLKFPDRYAFPPHWHPNLEHVTVVSGTFYLGMGDTVKKEAAMPYQPGDYLIAPARMSHFGWVKGETVIQLHGIGPFDIKLAGENGTKTSALTYNDISVPGFDAGLKMAVLHGDPGKAEPYTLRLKFPDGYAFPPHWHPNLEHVTVVSGTFYLGMGDTVKKEAAMPYQPGDYLIAPARMSHFGWVKGETVIQLHGIGPFDIKLAGEK